MQCRVVGSPRVLRMCSEQSFVYSLPALHYSRCPSWSVQAQRLPLNTSSRVLTRKPICAVSTLPQRGRAVHSTNTRASEEKGTTEDVPKKKRGRPKGSKNVTDGEKRAKPRAERNATRKAANTTSDTDAYPVTSSMAISSTSNTTKSDRNTSSIESTTTTSINSTKPSPQAEVHQAKQESWAVQKSALETKFKGAAWNPGKRVSPDAMEGIRALHAQAPTVFTTPVLAQHFEVSPESIRRILKSKWRPSEFEAADRLARWERRGQRKWADMAAKGVKPPQKWRAQGIHVPGFKPAWVKGRMEKKLGVMKVSASSRNNERRATQEDIFVDERYKVEDERERSHHDGRA